MKRFLLLPFLLFGIELLSSGQPSAVGGQPGGYYIASRAQGTRVWKQIVSSTNATDATLVMRTNSFTEISPGASHLVGGRWVDSSDQIQITATGAQATNAQHSISFLGNINSGGTNGAVTITTPDGKRLSPSILGLSYWDTVSGSSVFIAELTDSLGQLLPPGNEAIFTNAFTGIQADICYQNRVSQLDQLVLIHQQLPDPTQWNMDPASTMFQVITAFANPPSPTISPVATQNGQDDFLNFGVMQMIQGAAFAIGSEANRIPVTKRWLVLDGQTCLVEQVPFAAIQAALQNLGLPPAASNSRGATEPQTSLLAKAMRKRANQPKLVAATDNPFLRAQNPVPATKGFAMDFTLVVSVTNLLCACDTTYLVDNGVTATLSGSNVFCGASVIKFGTNSAINIVPSSGTPTATFLGTQDQPTTFTAKDDSSCGQQITTNAPRGYYANPALFFTGLSQTPALNYVRFAYAKSAVGSAGVSLTISHAQFVNCQSGISPVGCTIRLRNALFCNTATNIAFAGPSTVSAENVTSAGTGYLATTLAGDAYSTFLATNCIFANVTNLVSGAPNLSGDYNGFYQTTPFGYDQAPPVSAWPFQTVAAGSFYLSSDLPWRNAGTFNINSSLLADLKNKTTYPPVLLTNAILSDTVLWPQAQRNTGPIDLGFHYDPIDYLTACTVSNSTLTLTNGVVVAYYNNGGIWLQNGSSLVSFGGPTQRNWLAHYSLIQEQPIDLAPPGTTHVNSMPVNTYHTTIPSKDPSISLRFTSIAAPNSASYILYTDSANWETSTLLLQDCEVWGSGAAFSLQDGSTSTLNFRNNLFDHTVFGVLSTATLTAYNNLFRAPANYNEWIQNFFGTGLFTNRDNVYDGCLANLGGTCSTNAYVNGATNSVRSPGDIYTNLVWVTGPLGNFYQPTNSPLINAGDRTANLLGLFHYTVVTNLINNWQIKETNSVVDIGYHRVALDANGVPISTPGDSIPDYLADANGNGLVDPGETSWTNYTSLNGLTSTTGLQVFTPLQ